ncbi:MAG: hypothetical protein BGO43_00530 [Gammaproteobacteria bacterium 39-13]|nr:SRPBCC domain-containing protein [Gammaproteobacteria bacterium]OJV96743.1 MAG: hypothetical protein BGO43_00530 [Gammaproteobacteria bacterium 39-13]
MQSTTLVIKRTISASCEEVFAAWSQPELMKKWLFPLRPGWHALASNDFKVGGHYKQEMIAADGKVYAHTGIYQEIIPNQKIVFTWNSDSVQNTLVTIELRPEGNKTELTLIHELLPNEEQKKNHNEGWEGCLDNLSQFASENYPIN